MASENSGNCLFAIVVKMKREFVTGRRSSSCSRSVVTVVVGGIGSDRVGGKPRPPKVVTKTLIFDGAMMNVDGISMLTVLLKQR